MSALAKKRVDQLLVERGLVPSRTRAQSEIDAGHVWSGCERIRKANTKLLVDAALDLKGGRTQWVSRAALKLEQALNHFAVELKEKVVLDVGASTGGFTQVSLARGASRVYAVDVGHGQLHESIRADNRVTVLEGVNARTLGRGTLKELVDVIVCDVSFIGLEKVLPSAIQLSKRRALLIALIKPQFEAGPGKVDRRGVLKGDHLHGEICQRIESWIASQIGWTVLGLTDSPILGSDGNREYLIAAQKNTEGRPAAV
jgi:23S rRNA (cytidine1920-2'-O)/16S rRNA (cytidine1409-2'-O)-methyltransferase